MTTLAVFSAIAFLMTLISRNISFMPGYPFLTLDMKDVVIVIMGFIFGPMSSFLMVLVVSFIEMITISSTGYIGMLMNVISSTAFACAAAYAYSRHQSMRGAVIGLVLGVLTVTVSMLLWNYIATPIFQGVPRHVIAAALIPVFLPFNLIKYGVNAAVTILVYKPLVNTLRKARLLPVKPAASGGRVNIGLMLTAALVLVTLTLVIVLLANRA